MFLESLSKKTCLKAIIKKGNCCGCFDETKFILILVAYSDKMLFLDLGPGTSDLGSLI